MTAIKIIEYLHQLINSGRIGTDSELFIAENIDTKGRKLNGFIITLDNNILFLEDR